MKCKDRILDSEMCFVFLNSSIDPNREKTKVKNQKNYRFLPYKTWEGSTRSVQKKCSSGILLEATITRRPAVYL